MENLILASLLHDIGKLIMRANGFTNNHSEIGIDYIKNQQNDILKNDDILKSIKYHHANALYNANLENNHIAYLVYEADNIAAGTDRRKDLDKEIEEEKSNWDKNICISSVFNKIKSKTNYVYKLRDLSDYSPNMPVNSNDEIVKTTQNKYKDLKSWIDKNLNNIKNSNSLLQLLEATMSFVPSSTNTNEVADISLYDHQKLTAAIASCMYSYFKEKDENNFKEKCFNKDTIDKNRKENYYKIVSFDLSGIQNFIYTIASESALKSLRARSFYLEFIMEHIQDELLDSLNLSRANILYSGGGHSYLLLPNTNKTTETLNEIQVKVNNWFIDKFYTNLYLTYEEQECSSDDLMKNSKEIFKKLSLKLSKAKLQKYSIEQLENLFDVEANKKKLYEAERECKVCKNSSAELSEKKDICELCESLIELGGYLVKKNDNESYAIVVSSDKEKYSIELPTITENKKYFKIYNVKKDVKQNENKKIYAINDFSESDYFATNIWIGDYCAKDENEKYGFEYFADNSEGIKRLAVFRADVDNLGTTFTNGFGENYSTISRYATLSRTLNLFFKHYIKDLCKDKKLAIVYSGGDDVFVVGSWNDVLDFGKDLSRKFKEYSCQKLSLSAGIGFFNHKYPISKMAEQTGNLEDFAKKNNDNKKNSVALFGENKSQVSEEMQGDNFVFTWEEFDEILTLQKFIEDRCYFDEEKKENDKVFFSTALIYRIMVLINSKEEINLARFAYTLARMENSSSNYAELKKKLYDLYQSDKKKLLTVLNLIIYKNRNK